MGRELEDNWIAALMDLIKRKDRKFRSSGFEKHDRNWLLAYDNWRPHPSNLNDQDLECLARQLHGSSFQNAFDKVFVLRNSGKQNSHGLLEFSPCSTEYLEYPINDFLSKDAIVTEEQIEGLGEPGNLQIIEDYPLV